MVYYKEFLFEDSVDAVIVDNEHISFGGVGKEFYLSLWDVFPKDDEQAKKAHNDKVDALLKIRNAVDTAIVVIKKNHFKEYPDTKEKSEETSSDS